MDANVPPELSMDELLKLAEVVNEMLPGCDERTKEVGKGLLLKIAKAIAARVLDGKTVVDCSIKIPSVGSTVDDEKPSLAPSWLSEVAKKDQGESWTPVAELDDIPNIASAMQTRDFSKLVYDDLFKVQKVIQRTQDELDYDDDHNRRIGDEYLAGIEKAIADKEDKVEALLDAQDQNEDDNSDEDNSGEMKMASQQTSIVNRCIEFTERDRRGNDDVNFRLGDVVKIRDENGIWMIVDFRDGDPKDGSTAAHVRMIATNKLEIPDRKHVIEQYLGRCVPLTKQEMDRFTSRLHEDVESLERIFSDAYIEGVEFFKNGGGKSD